MHRTVMPIEQLLAWAKLNGVELNEIDVKADLTFRGQTDRGAGLISRIDRHANDDEKQILITVPQDLILSQERIKQYAAIDVPLKMILAAAAAAGSFGQTPRGAIMIFLLLQITNASLEYPKRISVTNPHTDYVKLLPRHVLLPTFYTDEEKDLLFGTSLQDALDQKTRSLETEFDLIHECTQHISWCLQHWWDEETGKLTFEDWMLVDALYRSRALDLPGAGHAMVPFIDMANHAPSAEVLTWYGTNEVGEAILQMRPGKRLAQGDEVTLTYGEEKGACEMLFSYGFLETGMTDAKAVFLDLDIPQDDPLRFAKKAVNTEAPGAKLFAGVDGKPKWEGNYIWWACVNEEDGLDFRVIQETDGKRELQVYWKDQRIDPAQLSSLLADDPRWDIFRLRAVVLLQERVDLQAAQLEAGEEIFTQSRGQSGVRDVVRGLIGQLRTLEKGLLSLFHEFLEGQKTELLRSPLVRQQLLGASMDEEA